MHRRLDKSLLRRLNQIEPPIDPDVLADTLCDGELLAVVLDHWVIAEFSENHGVVVNLALCSDPALLEKIPSLVAQKGARETERQINKFYDFEILNDPACPKEVLKYILETLAYLWEAQARLEMPARNLKFRVGFDPDEGVDGAHYIQMTAEDL